MTQTIRWGILSTGTIAHSFARGLSGLPDTEILAVGSRSRKTADEFADKFGIPRRYASYEALALDPDVDVIYVATPHPFHAENSLMCLDAGKAVLCEKPFALNAKEAEAVIRRARAKRLFLMEAMWTRFTPVFTRVRELLAEGFVGEVRLVEADFGFYAPFDPNSRLYAPELGGGALLDVGIYPVALASLVLGIPEKILSTAHLGQTGVDEQSAMLFTYPQGQLAVLSCAITTNTALFASISGTQARIEILSPWWQPQALKTITNDGEEKTFDLPFMTNGYEYEAMEVMRCLRAGALESPIMPLDETLALMRVLDAVRAQWGLKYPSERA